MSHKIEPRPTFMTHPSHVSASSKNPKLRRAFQWGATIALNILSFGTLYAAARTYQFAGRARDIAKYNAKAYEVDSKGYLERAQTDLTEITKSTAKHLFFYKTGATGLFGNFSPLKTPLKVQCQVFDPDTKEFNQKSLEFSNVEAAFQYTKWSRILYENKNKDGVTDQDKADIAKELAKMQKATGREAFFINRRLERKYQRTERNPKGKFDEFFAKDWKGKESVLVMHGLLKQKWSAEPFKTILDSTKGMSLVEHQKPGLTRPDGTPDRWSDGNTGHGYNLLGKLIERIRDNPEETVDQFAQGVNAWLGYAENKDNSNASNIANEAIANDTLGYAPYEKGNPIFLPLIKFIFSRPDRASQPSQVPPENECVGVSEAPKPESAKTSEENADKMKKALKELQNEGANEANTAKLFGEIERKLELLENYAVKLFADEDFSKNYANLVRLLSKTSPDGKAPVYTPEQADEAKQHLQSLIEALDKISRG